MLMQPLVDLDKVFNQITDANVRKQEVGNAIFPIIKERYGELASKITGMLLDNEQVVDRYKLVTEGNYLIMRCNDAYRLLTQQKDTMAPQQQPPQQ